MGLGDMVLVDFQTVLIPVALDACLSALAAGGLLQVALVMWLVSYELCVLIRRSWDSEMTWNLHLSSVFYKYGMLLTDQALLPSRWESGVIKMGVVDSESSRSQHSERPGTARFSLYTTDDS